MSQTDARHDAQAAAELIERLGQALRAAEQAGDLHPVHWTALRYLARANRFSRTPIALTRYLGATRGTVSQTLIALEKKQLVRRTPSARDKRSVEVEITPAGTERLRDDPIATLAEEIAARLGSAAAELRAQLDQVARGLLARQGGRAFGVCRACKHFRPGDAGRHRCALLEVDLSDADAQMICAEQEAA